MCGAVTRARSTALLLQGHVDVEPDEDPPLAKFRQARQVEFQSVPYGGAWRCELDAGTVTVGVYLHLQRTELRWIDLYFG